MNYVRVGQTWRSVGGSEWLVVANPRPGFVKVQTNTGAELTVDSRALQGMRLIDDDERENRSCGQTGIDAQLRHIN